MTNIYLDNYSTSSDFNSSSGGPTSGEPTSGKPTSGKPTSDKYARGKNLSEDGTNISLSQEEQNEFINNDFAKICKDYKYVPSIMPSVRRIIVLGDIHGDFDLAIKMLEKGKVIEKGTKGGEIKWIGEDTHVVQVGDQIDRCRPKSIGNLLCSDPKGTINDEASDIKILRLFTDLHNQAIEEGGKVISLLGNHELMNVSGVMDYVSYRGLREFDNFIDPENKDLKFKSGEQARKYAFLPGKPVGKLLGCSRLSAVIIGSNLFVHAGMLNKLLDKLNIKKPDDLESINILIKKWLLGLINKEYVKYIVGGDQDSMFWTRILGGIPPNISNENPICIEHISKVLKLFNIDSIIIGHTPQPFTYNQGINATCGNGIWRVDNASSSAFHGYDSSYLKSGEVNMYREPQVLEIINDKNFIIL